jgi:NADPH:quinone reductase
MRAVTYTRPGDPSVLELLERPTPEPGAGEIRIRLLVSGVNPTDWKSRSGATGGEVAELTVPNHDGAGVVDELGAGVDRFSVGDRVWVTLAGAVCPGSGTAQEYTVVPVDRAFALPATADFELGASIGIPAVTAHRALTVAEDGPTRLQPGALGNRSVLVAGGAGAVGNAAIQLARWAEATVIATVSSPEKAQLAAAAGADHVINYRQQDVAAEVRKIAPKGADAIVEVNPAVNAAIDAQVLALHGAVAMYADDAGAEVTIPVRSQMMLNARWQFVLLYTEPARSKEYGVEDVNAAVLDGAVRVGRDAGLPLHVFPLEQAPQAQQAVQDGVIGKVLIDVTA